MQLIRSFLAFITREWYQWTVYESLIKQDTREDYQRCYSKTRKSPPVRRMGYPSNGSHCPITRFGKSNKSRRIEKQKAQGTGSPEGFSSTQWE